MRIFTFAFAVCNAKFYWSPKKYQQYLKWDRLNVTNKVEVEMAKNTVHPHTFRQAVMSCGAKVAIGGFLIVAVSACLGAAIENKRLVEEAISAAWTLLLWFLSFGGNFWGAIWIGGIAMSAVVLISCTVRGCLNKYKKFAFSLLIIFFTMWLLADIAVFTTFTKAASLDSYQKVALLALNVPVIAFTLACCIWVIQLRSFGLADALPLLGFLIILFTVVRNLFN